MQTKKQSAIETSVNIAIGFAVSLVSTFIIFPLVGVETSPKKNVEITLYFTVVSILRAYFLRRYFNKKHLQKYPEADATKAFACLDDNQECNSQCGACKFVEDGLKESAKAEAKKY